MNKLITDLFERKCISVIIVSWNVRDFLYDCISSIYKYSAGYVLEIIVIDNNSSDNSVEMIKKEFPAVFLIENNVNRGFAYANNQGVKIANGEYIFFLNPDTILVENALEILIREISHDIQIGLVGPKIIYPDGNVQKPCARKLPSIGFVLFCDSLKLDKFPIIGNYINKKFIYPYDFNVSQYVEAISGAAMLSKTKIIKDINGFGMDYIHTGEDLEMCYQILRNGYLIKYVSDASIVHFSGRSAIKAKVVTEINSAISVGFYFKRTKSKNMVKLYRFIIKYFKLPIMVSISLFKFIFLNSEFRDFKETILIAKGILAWEQV